MLLFPATVIPTVFVSGRWYRLCLFSPAVFGIFMLLSSSSQCLDTLGFLANHQQRHVSCLSGLFLRCTGERAAGIRFKICCCLLVNGFLFFSFGLSRAPYLKPRAPSGAPWLSRGCHTLRAVLGVCRCYWQAALANWRWADWLIRWANRWSWTVMRWILCINNLSIK